MPALGHSFTLTPSISHPDRLVMICCVSSLLTHQDVGGHGRVKGWAEVRRQAATDIGTFFWLYGCTSYGSLPSAFHALTRGCS